MIARIGVVIVVMCGLAACDSPTPEVIGGPPAMRRLTEAQYRQVIADVFGSDIVVGGRFDPILRTDGLLTVGAAVTAITPAAFGRYESLARTVAGQITDAAHRHVLIPCQPGNPAAADDVCAQEFLGGVGRLLFRRSLTEAERQTYVDLARRSTSIAGGFYGGLSAALSAMLVSPEFLFVTDRFEADPNHSGAYRLTHLSLAGRLSFLLWNTTPDDALLTAAETGALGADAGLAAEVDRMAASPRLAAGARAFFDDMLGLDGVALLQKDPVIYPAFGLGASDSAREQILRTVVDHLIVRGEDYRSLFSTRRTFMNASLGPVYRVAADHPQGWRPVEFGDDDARAGIQTLVGFSALHSHPGRSSATLRGRAIREILMCQKVPDPPPGVDFTLVSDSHNPIHKTARQRLAAHSTDPTCAGCHRITDPIGLALEGLDGAGQARRFENGVSIDVSSDLDGVPFDDATGLGRALANNPAISSCLVGRAFAYAVGRPLLASDRPALIALERGFANSGYRFPALLRHIALSPAFTAITPPNADASARGAGPS